MVAEHLERGVVSGVSRNEQVAHIYLHDEHFLLPMWSVRISDHTEIKTMRRIFTLCGARLNPPEIITLQRWALKGSAESWKLRRDAE